MVYDFGEDYDHIKTSNCYVKGLKAQIHNCMTLLSLKIQQKYIISINTYQSKLLLQPYYFCRLNTDVLNY